MKKIDPKFSELKKLMEEKNSLVKEGKYLEAEDICQKILSIKNDSSSNKQDSLHSTQQKQSQSLEEEYKNERKELEKNGTKKFRNSLCWGKNKKKNWSNYTIKKWKNIYQNWPRNIPHIKYSTEYLNGRLQENKLAKQERFLEAANKKFLNDKMQQKENEKYENDRNENINKNAESLGLK